MAIEHCSLGMDVQRLDDDCVARLLLMVHMRLLSARNPHHRRIAFSPFQLLLTLLEGRVLVPATFRYATQMLLQLLCFRWLRQLEYLWGQLA